MHPDKAREDPEKNVTIQSINDRWVDELVGIAHERVHEAAPEADHTCRRLVEPVEVHERHPGRRHLDRAVRTSGRCTPGRTGTTVWDG